MTNKEISSELTVTGCDVETNLFPGDYPCASCAEYSLANQGKAREIAVTAVVFIANDNPSQLETYHLYSGDSELALEFPMPANDKLRLRITFPFISIGAGGGAYEVKASFMSEGREYEAVSNLIFTFEIEE